MDKETKAILKKIEQHLKAIVNLKVIESAERERKGLNPARDPDHYKNQFIEAKAYYISEAYKEYK